MTIEPARDVRRGTVDETAWFVAGGLLIVAGLITAVAVCASGRSVVQARHLRRAWR